MNRDVLSPVVPTWGFDRRNSTIRRRFMALVAAFATVTSMLVLTSPASADSPSWTAQSAAEANIWRSVAYGNGKFVAVAANPSYFDPPSGANRVMTSVDGVSWTAQSAAAGSWVSVTYGNGTFVAVATDGANRVMTSPDGVTWTAQIAAVANSWMSVTYGNGTFVAVAISGPQSSRVMTSPDGVSWTAQAAAELNYWWSVTYGNGKFVAVAISGSGSSNLVMTSPDGEVWTAQASAETNDWNSVTYGNGKFVAVSSYGNHRVMTSPDGVSWTAQAAAEANSWQSVTFGDGKFVAVANSGMNSGTNRVMTSADGVSWAAQAAAEDNSWQSVTYGSGKFVAVSKTGSNRVMTLATASAPAAPTSLVATPGDGSASIAFTAGSDGGASISKYQYKIASGAWTDAVGTTSPITVSGLTNLVATKIRLRAVNSVGTGAASTSVTVTPRPAGPSIVSSTPSGRTGFIVTFNSNPLPGTTVAYQSVKVYARGLSTVLGTCRTFGKQTTCRLGGLTRGTDYDLRATAHLPVVGRTWHNSTLEGATLQVRTNG